MTNQQIADRLFKEGFAVQRYYDGVIVSLNHKISIQEVRYSLGYQIPDEMFTQLNDKVVVTGKEGDSK